jgi:single-strand DNA-binding protein
MNLNLVQLCGRLTKKPLCRKTQTGTTVTTFSVAINRSWEKDGVKTEETEFINCTAFGRTADSIAKWFDKGDEIYIAGRIKNRQWEDKEQVRHYATDVIAERFDFGQKSRQNAVSAKAGVSEGVDRPSLDDGIDQGQLQTQVQQEIEESEQEKLPVIDIDEDGINPDDLPFLND